MVLKGVLPFFDKKKHNLTSDLGIRANGRNVAGREVPFSPFPMGKNRWGFINPNKVCDLEKFDHVYLRTT